MVGPLPAAEERLTVRKKDLWSVREGVRGRVRERDRERETERER